MSDIVFIYDEKKNPGGATLSGVPLADISLDRLSSWPLHIIQSVDACVFYRVANGKRDAVDKLIASLIPTVDDVVDEEE